MCICKEIACKSALHCHNKKGLPFGWDLNVYRGCAHGCKYCYALYSHKYIAAENYFSDIFVKTNIVDRLEAELSSPDWGRHRVNLGGVTDNYQPAERKYKLMPEILKLFIKYKTPVVISTKSTLILRDYELIAELAYVAKVNIAATVITADYNMQRIIEPGGADIDRRFHMLQEFSKTKAVTGLHVMPVIPWLTDSYDNLDTLFGCAAASGVSYVLPGTLYLRSQTRKLFFHFVDQKFPELYGKFMFLYKEAGAMKDYKVALYSMVNKIRHKYGYC